MSGDLRAHRRKRKRKNDEVRDRAPEQISTRVTLAVLAALLVAIIATGALLLATRPESATITIQVPPPSATPLPPGPIEVYVTGAVVNPERIYTLPHGSRVDDAIRAAGGFTSAADKARVNLAGILRDGDQIHAPAKAAPAGPLPTPMGGMKVHVNTATQAELETLPGIGPVTAASIIEYREQVGRFGDLDDLQAVRGIGAKTIEKLAALVILD